MKAFRIHTDTKLNPFGDSINDALLGGLSLGMMVSRALVDAGLEPELAPLEGRWPENQAFLVLPDTQFVSRACLKAFLQNCADKPDGVWRLALRRGPASDYCLPLQDVEAEANPQHVPFDVFWVSGNTPIDGESWPKLRDWLIERSRIVELDPGDEVEWIDEPRPGPPKQRVALPRTLCLAGQVRHWVHLLWLNHLMPRLRLREHWADHAFLAKTKTAGHKNPYDRLARLNIIGRGCDIHPTAYVEGSILGDGVRLGPFASVRDCVLGDEVEVGDHTHFLRCVVGAHCHTLNDSTFIGCTFYPDSTLANIKIRHSVLGKKTFLTSGVIFWDECVEKPATVQDKGVERPTGRWNLGGCAGHNCLLGTRAIFTAGREVPNRTMIVMRPEEGATKIPTQAKPRTLYVLHEGRIMPLHEALPGYSTDEIEFPEPP